VDRSDKIFLIIVVILFLFSLWGLIFKVHAGEIHGDCLFGYITETSRNYQIELGLEYDFELLSFPIAIGGSYLTQMEFAGDDNIRFAPYNEQYRFFTEINPFEIFIFRFQHACVHPVYSGEEQFEKHFEERGNKTVISMGIRW